MTQWITEYANAADDWAPYAGPTILAASKAEADRVLVHVLGPNGEPLILVGELVERVRPELIRDTFTIIRPSA